MPAAKSTRRPSGRKRPSTRTRTKDKVRKDPQFRHIDTSLAKVGLVNADPNRFYVGVNQADPNGGVGHYRAMGYVVEEYTHESDVHFRSVSPELGKPVEKAGAVLMSIDKERHDEIIQHGEDGDGGLEYASAQEKRIINNREGVDEMRGLHRRLARFASARLEYDDDDVDGI